MQAVSQQRTSVLDRLDKLFQTIKQPKYYWMTRPLMAFLVTRVIMLCAAYLADIALPGATGVGLYHVDPSNVFLDVWARWDSGFYLTIAKTGYTYVPGLQNPVAFFPLYPLLMNLITPI